MLDRLVYAFLLGVVVTILLAWLWELMTRAGHRDFVRFLDNRVAPDKVAEIVGEIREGKLGALEREEIWHRMSWIWKEARLMALASSSVLAIPFLGAFLAVYVLLWFKTLVRPNSHDIRFLIACETVLLSVVNRENGAAE